MKVDNFVLLMISIITLIIISLVTECNRGRLKELEDKATQEIKETFFGHLGLADPTELGEWGYRITGITEGQYGGRSRQEVLNNIGGHDVGNYIRTDQYGGYVNTDNISGNIIAPSLNVEDTDWFVNEYNNTLHYNIYEAIIKSGNSSGEASGHIRYKPGQKVYMTRHRWRQGSYNSSSDINENDVFIIEDQLPENIDANNNGYFYRYKPVTNDKFKVFSSVLNTNVIEVTPRIIRNPGSTPNWDTDTAIDVPFSVNQIWQ